MTSFPTEDERNKMNISLQQVMPADIRLYYLPQLTQIYTNNGMQPVWQETAIRHELEAQLTEVALAGVQPQFSTWTKWLSRTDLKGISRDILLTDALLGYLQFIQEMNKDSRKLYGKHTLPQKQPSPAMVSLLQEKIQGKSLGYWIPSLAPQYPGYKPTRVALRRIVQDEQPWPILRLNKTVRPGDKITANDYDVLQQVLARQAAWNGQSFNIDESAAKQKTYYDEFLVKQVKKFQQQRRSVSRRQHQ